MSDRFVLARNQVGTNFLYTYDLTWSKSRKADLAYTKLMKQEVILETEANVKTVWLNFWPHQRVFILPQK